MAHDVSSLTLRDAMRGLTKQWAEDAARLRRYGTGGGPVEVLERCSAELEQLLDDGLPTWISLADVQARTGWARKTLRRRFAELAGEVVPGTDIPLARRRPWWELHASALDRIQPKGSPGPLPPPRTDDPLQEWAEQLAQDVLGKVRR